MRKKDEQFILLGLAAIGIAALLFKRKKNNNENNTEGLGKLPSEYTKVGRINMTIARKAHVKAGDIVVHPNYIRHIEKEHGKQLAELGISAAEYISVIASNFCQIRKGSGNSILLVVRSSEMYIVLALNMTNLIDDEFPVWEIHTSYPTDKFTKSQKLLWER